MTEPTGYVLATGIDAPDMVHLNPTPESKCGGRMWSAEDPTLEGSNIDWQEVDEATALAMLARGEAVPCRRCDMKDHPDVETTVYGKQEGPG
jgi:hypothetical protein